MQLLLPLADGTDDAGLAEAARAQGINITPLSPCTWPAECLSDQPGMCGG